MRLSRKEPLLTEQEEHALARQVKGDDPALALAARNTLVERNLGLAGMAVSWYMARKSGLDYDDLFSEAVLGLIRAAQLYEPGEREARFAPYALRACFHAIRSYIGRDQLIRPPNYLQDPAQVEKMLAEVRLKRTHRSLRSNLARAEAAKARHQSLSQPLRDHGDEPLTLIDEKARSPLELAIAAEERSRLPEALGRLRPLEAYVVAHRHGLFGLATKSLKELGQEIGLSKERVRVIECQALARLRIALSDCA